MTFGCPTCSPHHHHHHTHTNSNSTSPDSQKRKQGGSLKSGEPKRKRLEDRVYPTIAVVVCGVVSVKAWWIGHPSSTILMRKWLKAHCCCGVCASLTDEQHWIWHRAPATVQSCTRVEMYSFVLILSFHVCRSLPVDAGRNHVFKKKMVSL